MKRIVTKRIRKRADEGVCRAHTSSSAADRRLVCRLHSKVITFFSLLMLTFLCASCFLGGQGPNHPKGPGHYETAWVDPELIVSDSLISLIRSDRLDKVFVTDKEKRHGENQPSFEFVITQDFCTVEVDMVGSKSVVVEPLFHGTLRPGNYKLTVDPSRIDTILKRQKLSVRADFCGRKKTFDLSVSR
jgi:hypothetical protein